MLAEMAPDEYCRDQAGQRRMSTLSWPLLSFLALCLIALSNFLKQDLSAVVEHVSNGQEQK